jgi:hypothetical protein
MAFSQGTFYFRISQSAVSEQQLIRNISDKIWAISGRSMIISAKCTNKECDAEGKVIPATQLFLAKAGPLAGPFDCPQCNKLMTRVRVVPENYKGNASSKRISGSSVSSQEKPKSNPKSKKVRGLKVKGSGLTLRARSNKQTKKTNVKKQGQRKKI